MLRKANHQVLPWIGSKELALPHHSPEVVGQHSGAFLRDVESLRIDVVFFFFQAEDGIRDLTVTGVQTCALPICSLDASGEVYIYNVRNSLPYDDETFQTGTMFWHKLRDKEEINQLDLAEALNEIGRASCRERV